MRTFVQLLLCVILVIAVVGSPNALAFGKKYYIQLGSCYLQKCVADKVNKATPYGWPVTVHRAAHSSEIYQVVSVMAYDETDADIFITELRRNDALKTLADLHGVEIGYLLSLGIYQSVAKAYQMKALAEQVLVEDKVHFSIKRRSKKNESSKILVGPFYTEKKARELKKQVRATPEFPNAFLIVKE